MALPEDMVHSWCTECGWEWQGYPRYCAKCGSICAKCGSMFVDWEPKKEGPDAE